MFDSSNAKPQRYAIYCRVSTEDQADSGTIENQVDFARRYCDLHQLMVHDFYLDDGVSGTIPVAERLQGGRLLADAKAHKFGVVLIYRVDRLARSTLYLLNAHEELKAAGVALRSMTEPFDTSSPLGEFIMTLLGSLAALERATILERTALGRLRAARAGRWLGGLPPFGYRVDGPENNRRLVVHPEEARIVARIFDLYVNDGLGLIPIMELLNAEGVPSPYQSRGVKTERWPERERQWNTGTLSRILTNTAYVGRYRAGKRAAKEIAEYETPAILEQSLFDDAQRLLKERFIDASRNSRRLYLLRGLIHCYCGRTVVGDGHHSSGQFYYRCTNDRAHFHQRAEVLEEAVWQDVANFARNPGEVLALLQQQLQGQARETEGAADELAEVGRQIALKKAEREPVITLYRRGRITEQELDTQLDALNAEIATLEARQQVLFGRQTQAQAREVSMLSAGGLLSKLGGRVDQIEQGAESGDDLQVAAALEDKRALIKALVQSILTAEDGSLNVTYTFAEPANSSVHGSACTEQSATIIERTLILQSTGDAARRLGVGRKTVERAIRAGDLPALRPAGCSDYYVPADAVLPPKVCQQCGAVLEGKAQQRQFCAPCRQERKREAQLRFYYRKAGRPASDELARQPARK